MTAITWGFGVDEVAQRLMEEPESKGCGRESRCATAGRRGNQSGIITQLGLDMARQRESFARQWHVVEVPIITMSGKDIGWLQTKTSDSTLFLGQLYLSVHMHSAKASAPGFCKC